MLLQSGQPFHPIFFLRGAFSIRIFSFCEQPHWRVKPRVLRPSTGHMLIVSPIHIDGDPDVNAAAMAFDHI